jgi:transposase
MIQVTPHMRILVAHESIDFRKGIDGLARICRVELCQDPFEGAVFVFRNRRKTGIKILVYDGQGFWLCHKRLSKGRFHWWPDGDDTVAGSELEAFRLQVLIAAGDPNNISSSDPWKSLSPTTYGTQNSKAGVPKDVIKLGQHGNHYDIQRKNDHRPGYPVHEKLHLQIPSLQSP